MRSTRRRQLGFIGGSSSIITRTAVKTGTLVFVGHANDPGDSVGDYLECNGQNVSRTTYAALFAKWGVTWGAGDGSTTFTLLDARRRSPVGKGGTGTATLGNAVGNTGGEETHVLTVAELAAHAHGVNDPTHGHGVSDPTHAHSGAVQTGNALGGSTTAVDSVSGTLQNRINSNIVNIGGLSINASGTGISINGAGTGISIQNNGSGTAHNTYHPSYVSGVWVKT